MYFPYIRGKQFDLAALAELNDAIYKKNKVIPIIEPVAAIKSLQFRRLSDRNIPFLLVTNPVVGELKSVSVNRTIQTELLNNLLSTYKNYWVAFTIQAETTLKDVQTFISTFPNHYHAFIHFYKFKDVSALSKLINADKRNQFNIFIDSRVNVDYAEKFNADDAQDIIIKDGFNKRPRNEDYPAEEYFYDLHRTYDVELGYDGFGDFTVIGSQFDKGGGPAYVVALHLSDTDDEEDLIVRHFKSDALVPPSPADPGGKFRQALRRLKRYVDTVTHLDTEGLDEFLDLSRTGHYPGLGVAKKISVKHHIELVHSLL